MAGRPRTMARRVQQLLKRRFAQEEELQELISKQYHEPTNDTLGRCWRRALEASGDACEYLGDLTCFLDFKADEAEKRAKFARAASEPSPVVADLDTDGPPPVVADSPASVEVAGHPRNGTHLTDSRRPLEYGSDGGAAVLVRGDFALDAESHTKTPVGGSMRDDDSRNIGDVGESGVG